MKYDPGSACIECLRPATVIVDLPGAGPTQYCLACAKQMHALAASAANLRSGEAAAYRAALTAHAAATEPHPEGENLCRVTIVCNPQADPEIRVRRPACKAQWDAEKQRGCRYWDDPNDPTGYCFQHGAGWCNSQAAGKDATLRAMAGLMAKLVAMCKQIEEEGR